MTRTGIIAGITPAEITENDHLIGAAGSRDGAIHTMDWELARTIEGRAYTAMVGDEESPISFAKTTYDASQPQFVLDCPAGLAIVPTSIELYLQDAASTDNLVTALTTTLNVGIGSSTGVTPVNNKIDGGASDATVYTLYTGAGTDPGTGTENWFWSPGNAFQDATTSGSLVFKWGYKTHAPQLLVNTSALVIYILGATAPAGYLRVSWIELPATRVS